MLDTLLQALSLLVGMDRQVVAIVWLSFKVGVSTVTLATLIGLPLGALVGGGRRFRRAARHRCSNGMMGVCPRLSSA